MVIFDPSIGWFGFKMRGKIRNIGVRRTFLFFNTLAPDAKPGLGYGG